MPQRNTLPDLTCQADLKPRQGKTTPPAPVAAAPNEYTWERENWTLEDWLEKAPKMYAALKKHGHLLAKKLEAVYFEEEEKLAGKAQPDPESKARDKWALEDYLEKDPEALVRMQTEDPVRAHQLEMGYFNEN